MRSYEVTKSIRAQPDTVWGLLTDAAAYATWNRAVDRVEGRIALGETIKVHVPISPGRAFPVKVATFDRTRRMVWAGGLPLGLFKGTRTFTLTPSGSSDTEFSMREAYTGPLAGVMFRQIPDLTGAFEEFGSSLKAAAEANQGG